MTRTDYRKARALVRANGLYVLRWLTPEHASIMFAVVRPAADTLALRADVKLWTVAHPCKMVPRGTV